MKINRRLNLVVPVHYDSEVLHVHHVPISRQVFERYFLVISKTFAKIYTEGLGLAAGPRVAMLLLRATAEEMGVLDGPTGVEMGLIAEIKRLTHVIAANLETGGWQQIPYPIAIARQMIDEDDAAELENALAFFTVASSGHRREDRDGILTGASKLWGGETSLLDCTEFLNSLPTSTPIENSTPKRPKAASSLPI
jgi:hypothetical protein